MVRYAVRRPSPAETFSPSLRGRSKNSSRPLAVGVVDRALPCCSRPLTMPALTNEIRDMPVRNSQCPSGPDNVKINVQEYQN